jgi:hypothetical protein
MNVKDKIAVKSRLECEGQMGKKDERLTSNESQNNRNIRLPSFVRVDMH